MQSLRRSSWTRRGPPACTSRLAAGARERRETRPPLRRGSMKVLVTGGTGYIGSAVSLQLKKAGHDVQALVRNKDKAAALQAAGVKLVQGDLANPAGYA